MVRVRPTCPGRMRAPVDLLQPREAYVVRRRYGLDGGEPGTLRQIGGEIGISRERVRQIERQVIRRIRVEFPNLAAFAD